ncbi:fungal-specific transcription factor domain-containing protein [Mycena maculata]|uniref:Fungal-specific transcription factor domain-containing protein n=1 Tax=Mycena maculata TaxID=230809 RepID=A0AAD7MMF9_9AGAR|nr:fungal-specific transcription factor domain-containing protein [Mycena maculata]
MPVDKSKPPKTNARRPQESVSAEYISQSVPGASGITHARELEVKRSRGEIPCQSCVRRGCSALCPNGALATGQGTRFVLAATEHLHRKIARMSERIRALEDALTALHASKSGADAAAHPLLVDGENFALPDDAAPPGTAKIDGSWEVLESPDGRTPTSASGGDVIDAFGTLSISDHGISRFFGPTGGSEVSRAAPNSAFMPHHAPHNSPSSPSSYTTSPYASNVTPPHVVSPSTLFSPSSFPLTPLGSPAAVHALVISHLPSRARARHLSDTYFEQMAWLFRNTTRGQVWDMMRAIYGAYRPAEEEDEMWDGDAEGDGNDEEDYTGPHDLALLFMVFAVGALVQPTPPGASMEEDEAHRQRVAAEAEHLHQIARAALALQPILEKPSLVTIQTLFLLSVYTGMSGGGAAQGQDDGETSMEMTWSLITLAAHLSQTIGLHRDSARWGLSAKMVQRRRILFWDLFTADVWQSLNTGRPPSFSLAYIDCSLPTYEKSKAREGMFEAWGFRFAAECVAEVTARTLTAEAPSYATIMELDRKVREFPLPPLDDAVPGDVGGSLQRCVLEHVRETILMYIHRSFFAQAIIEQPVNPLKSTYAPSFLASYRASATVLKSVREQFTAMPNPCARYWIMWTFAFSAAVVFGTVVTRGPRSPMAAAAMAELDQACVLFSKAAVYSRRATKALPILTKLNEKARLALAAAQNDPSPLGSDNGGLLWSMTGVLGPGGMPVKVKKEEADDELSIFAGHTRFVSGQIQRGAQGASSVAFPAQQQQQQQQQQPQVRFSRQPPPRPIQGGEEMHYGSYEVPSQQYLGQFPVQQQLPPRQRQHSMPSSSNLHAMQQRPTINVDLQWEQQQHNYPQSAHVNSAVDEHSMQQHHFYEPNGARLPPPPDAPYAWPVDAYGLDSEHAQQHPHYPPHGHQQQYPHDVPDVYPPPQHAAAYQARNAELAQLGLASRDSRLDERWSTFMEESGLLEGIDFRAR